MLLRKVKPVVLVVLLLGLLGFAGGFIPSYGQARQQLGKPLHEGRLPDKAQEPEARPKAKAERPKGKEAILKARVVAAAKAYQGVTKGLYETRRFGNNLVQVTQNPEDVYIWSVRLLQAERELKPKKKDQIAALQEHLKRMTKLKDVMEQMARDLIPVYNVDKAEWYLLEAESWIEEAKAAK